MIQTIVVFVYNYKTAVQCLWLFHVWQLLVLIEIRCYQIQYKSIALGHYCHRFLLSFLIIIHSALYYWMYIYIYMYVLFFVCFFLHAEWQKRIRLRVCQCVRLGGGNINTTVEFQLRRVQFETSVPIVFFFNTGKNLFVTG